MTPHAIANLKPEQKRADSRRYSILGPLVKSLLIAWLLASMLFAHGCHGNEDHELFAAAADWIAAMK